MKHEQLVYDSPVKFNFKQRLSLSLTTNTVALAHRIICSTCKVEARGASQLREIQQTRGPVILAFWHEVLPLAIWTQRSTGYHTLTSYSYDGELAARVIEHFGLAAVRGSSSRGGRLALQQLEAALKLGVTIGITLDGPRGPRRVSKPGVAVLSARTNAPIVPLVLGVPRGWRMRSWDRMLIPKPFNTITYWCADPIEPAQDTSANEVERVRLEAESALNHLQVELEQELGMVTHWEPSTASGDGAEDP